MFMFPYQVALLDFGATRGFDETFTDLYIEVRILLLLRVLKRDVKCFPTNAFLLNVDFFEKQTHL